MRRVSRWLTILLVMVMFVSLSGTALALDTWSGTRDCWPGYELKVQSYASGTVKHFKNGAVVGSWYNSTLKWRTTYQGDEFQEVLVSATNVLQTVQTSCVCLSGICIESAIEPSEG